VHSVLGILKPVADTVISRPEISESKFRSNTAFQVEQSAAVITYITVQEKLVK